MTEDITAKEAQDKAFIAGTTAIQSATEAAAAIEMARSTDTAALLAKVDEKLRDHHNESKVEMKSVIIDVLENVFGKEQSTYIVKNRVPLLCQSVVEINKKMDKLSDTWDKASEIFVSQDSFGPVRNIVYGLVALLLTGIVTALIAMVIKQ